MSSTFLNYLSKRRYLLFIAIIILTLLTILLTLLPGDTLPKSNLWSFDKLGHFLMFGAWTYLIGLHRYFSTGNRDNLFTIFLLGVSFGILIELLQYALPVQRHADFFDIAFDSLGCLAAVLALKKSFSLAEPADFS